MRGKISDQDLTNYALNDGMSPAERLYVESMLGASEECRADVYRMLDVAQMLEEGFDREEAALPTLTDEQREQLLTARPRITPMAYVHRAAAALALAACAAFVLANPSLWQLDRHTSTMAAVSSSMSRMMTEVIAPDDEQAYSSYVTLEAGSEDDSGAFIQTSADMPMPDMTICTPPSWQDGADFAEAH